MKEFVAYKNNKPTNEIKLFEIDNYNFVLGTCSGLNVAWRETMGERGWKRDRIYGASFELGWIWLTEPHII